MRGPAHCTMRQFRRKLSQRSRHRFLNPTDPREIAEVDLSKANGDIQHNRTECFDEFMAKYSKGRVELIYPMQIEGPGNRKPILECDFFVFAKRDKESKIGRGGATIRLPGAGRGPNDMAIAVHFDAGNILTIGGVERTLEFAVLPEKRVTGEIKIRTA